MRRIAVMMLVLLLSGDAFARLGTIADQPNVRHQNLMRRARHELSLYEGVTLADPYTVDVLTQFAYQYHVTDWFGVGLEASGGFSLPTPLTKSLEDELTPVWEDAYPGRKYKLSRSGIMFMSFLKIDFVPFSGKLVLFQKYLGYVDFHVSTGAGFVRTRGIGNLDPESTFGVLVGGGFRFFPTKYVSVNIEVKDYMIYRRRNRPVDLSDSTKPVELPAGRSMTQNPVFMLGASFFFPMKPERGP